MKKIIVFTTVSIATFVAYSVYAYFLKMLYVQHQNDFENEKGLVFIQMILALVVWAGAVALFLFFIKKDFKVVKELEKSEKEYREYYSDLFEELHHWAIWSFATVGCILIPLLTWVNNDITEWIIR